MSDVQLLPWKESLVHLQELKANPCDELATNQLTWIYSKKLREAGADTMSEAACRKLVNDIKWPLHACTAVAQVAQQQPRSPGIPAAVRLLETFLSLGDVYFLERTSGVAFPNLQASVRQQVEQSGLLQQLPALMIAAAVELSVQAQDKSFISYGQQAATGFAVMSMLYATSIRQYARYLLSIFTNTCRLWTGAAAAVGRLNALVDAAAAAMQLGLAVTRHMSAEVEEHMRNPGTSPYSAFEMQELMRDTYWAMGNIATIVAPIVAQLGPLSPAAVDNPQLGRLLLSPQLVPCFVLQLTITALVADIVGPDIPDIEPTANGSSSSGSSGGSARQHQHSNHSRAGGTSTSSHSTTRSATRRHRPSSSSGGATAAEQRQPQEYEKAPPGTIPRGKCPCCVATVSEDWRLACERYSSLTPCHHKLFQLLGVDGRAVLWAAAASRPHCPSLSTIATYVVPYIEHINLVLRMPQQQQCMVATPRQQLERQLHLLLPTVLLHHAAALPVDHPGFPELCYVVGQTSSTALAAWEQLRPLMSAANMMGGAGCRAGGARYCPPDMELSQVLRLGCTLSASLHQRVATAAPCNAAAAAGAATFVFGAAGAAARAATAAEADRKLRMCKVAMAHLVDCICKVVAPAVHVDAVLGSVMGLDAVLAAMRGAEAAGEEHSVAPPVVPCGLFAPASVRDQAVPLMVTLERYLRSAGADAAAGQPFEKAELVSRSLISVLAAPACEDGPSQQPPPLDMGPLVALAAAAGPGSKADRQLHSLFVTALKVVGGPAASNNPGMEELFDYCSPAAAAGAARLLEDAGAMAASAAAAAAGAGSGSSSSSLEPGVVFLGLRHPYVSATPCDPLDQLPWATLHGRCCLLWAQQLQQEVPMLLDGQQENVGLMMGEPETWQQIADEAEATAPCITAQWCLQAVTDGETRLELFSSALLGWLEDPSVDARLSAAGYQPQQWVHELVRMLQARDDVEYGSDPAELTALVQALRAAGEALGCLATPVCCNNPACSSLLGATERQLVKGKGCTCAGCRTARYCDRACQRAHWKRHKPACKALAAAKQGTVTGGSD